VKKFIFSNNLGEDTRTSVTTLEAKLAAIKSKPSRSQSDKIKGEKKTQRSLWGHANKGHLLDTC